MLGDRGGEKGVLPGFSLSFSRGVLPAPCRVRAKKSSGPAAASADIAGSSCRGPEQHFYSTPLFSRTGHSAASSRLFELRRQDTGSVLTAPHGLTPLPGFLSDLPAGFF